MVLPNKLLVIYKNIKAIVRSPEGDTNFKIVTGVWHKDSLLSYLYILFLDYVLRTSIDLIKENGFTLKKKKEADDFPQKLTDTDYADDLAILTNKPTQAESLLHSLE